MKIHLFGAATPSGAALHQLAQVDVVGYSRTVSSTAGWLHPGDLNDPAGFQLSGIPESPSILISFAPIWLFAHFVEQLETHHPEWLIGLRGVIACSSSSTITKRFASNRLDRQLVARLIAAEDQLISTCRRLSVPCRILQPTMIYGQMGGLSDRNISRLLQLMRRLPFLPLPAETGLRQPIHVSQLSAVALYLANQIIWSGLDHSSPEKIALGGDSTLTYSEMIIAIQQSQSSGDPARRCRLLSIPNRLFFLLAAPLLLRSPKTFEAVLRIGANLSGFTPANQLLKSEFKPFPLLPLA